jgi:hypothetical protein
VLERSAASNGSWTEADIKEWGRLIKSYLSNYRN